MRAKLWSFVAVGLVLLTDPDRAWAWGPAAHIGLAGSILENLQFLPAAVAAILARHGASYLYGNIAADVVFAKRLSRVKQSCHHWSTGFRLLEAATDDRSRAFAYGYVSHLAADTVAHGKYVPRQILECRGTAGFGHLYWELRADDLESNATWERVEQVLRLNHEKSHRALECQIKDTFLPYEMNRLLFGSLNALAARKEFRRGIHVLARCSRWPLSVGLVDHYRAESLDRIHSVLAHGRRSTLMREDPNGTSAFMQLRVWRKEMRRLRRRGAPVGHRRAEMSRGLAPRPSQAMRNASV